MLLAKYKGTFPGRVPGLTAQRKHPGSRKQNFASFSWTDESPLPLLGKSWCTQHSEQVFAAVWSGVVMSLGVCALLPFLKRQTERQSRA